MKEVGTYFKEKVKQQPENNFTDGRCQVYGCPLKGTVSRGVNAPFYCSFHIDVKYEFTSEITAKIKKYESLINILDIALRPDIKFGHDIPRAELEVKHYLIRKNIEQMFVAGNLDKTSKNILTFLHQKIRILPPGEENA
jgi:hypothetical protein